ncbi:hypothetical protein [Kitasatospora indigofera]|uniref:hypothetical protein n=1 Tax=Kitasatospora indigofera TaxID=67307 RepID=UPI0036A4C621
MTRYSIDPERHELIATWGTGEGDLATRVTAVPAGTGTAALMRLARALTHLSEAAWRTYTHPASASSSMAPGSEGWRRAEERKAFDEVPGAVTRPNLPEDGVLDVEYSPLVESAHRAGRALHVLGNVDLTKAVLAETATELAAVENAELGDLTGRARQAVLLSREGACPVQVAAADRLLEQDPFGPRGIVHQHRPHRRGRRHRPLARSRRRSHRPLPHHAARRSRQHQTASTKIIPWDFSGTFSAVRGTSEGLFAA